MAGGDKIWDYVAPDPGVSLGRALYRGLYYFERGIRMESSETSMGDTPMQNFGHGSLAGAMTGV